MTTLLQASFLSEVMELLHHDFSRSVASVIFVLIICHGFMAALPQASLLSGGMELLHYAFYYTKITTLL